MFTFLSLSLMNTIFSSICKTGSDLLRDKFKVCVLLLLRLSLFAKKDCIYILDAKKNWLWKMYYFLPVYMKLTIGTITSACKSGGIIIVPSSKAGHVCSK